MGNLVRTITAVAIVLGVAAASGQQQAPAPERPVGMQATLDRLFPGEYPEVPEGGAVWVFAVQ